jgi:hypothetical protein
MLEFCGSCEVPLGAFDVALIEDVVGATRSTPTLWMSLGRQVVRWRQEFARRDEVQERQDAHEQSPLTLRHQVLPSEGGKPITPDHTATPRVRMT